MLQELLYILAGTFCAGVVLTPLVRRVAVWCGLVDVPDGRRKVHPNPVPLAGGMAVLLSVCLVLAVGLAVSDHLQILFLEHSSYLLGLLLAAVVICGIGLLDDFQLLRGRHKLLGQIVAVAIVMAFGVRISNIHLLGTEVDLGILAIPVTVLWLLGAINSLNLIDGMDGLLSTVGFLITAAMAAMAMLQGHVVAAMVAASLAGALLAFLCFNFPPASVFLGDSGSMVIGLVVGVLGIASALKAPATIALVAPVAIMTIPFLDTLAAITRRKLTGRSIYTTDRGHLHHVLLRRGLSTRAALLLISVLCLLTVGGAVASLAMRNELIAIVVAVTVIFTLVATRLFGHAELSLIGKRLVQLTGTFLDTRGGSKSHRLEVQFQGTTKWSDLLESVSDQAFELNLSSVRLEVNAPALHEHYHGQWHRFDEEPEDANFWRADLPLTIQGKAIGRLAIAGINDAAPLVAKIVTIIQRMEQFQAELAASAALAGAEVASKDAAVGVDKPTPRPAINGKHRPEVVRDPREFVHLELEAEGVG